jgi:zinc transporter ZupT
LKFSANVVPSFACGALLATTVFLIIPESLHMILGYLESQAGGDAHAGNDHRFLQDDHEGHDEHEDFDSAVAWRFGTCLLVGFLIPVIVGMFFQHYHHALEDCDVCQEEEIPKGKQLEEKLPEDSTSVDPETKTNFSCDDECCMGQKQESDEESPGRARSNINYPLAGAILIGDFFHNFADGIFVGTAFMLCSYDLAVTIALATIYHEIAQEVADFYVLTKHCNLKTWVALVLNFIGGLSVLIGALIVLAVDINSMISGCILAVGGGIYVHNAATECFPIAKASHDCMKDKIVCLFSFVIGAVPIGLVLLNHSHCGGD